MRWSALFEDFEAQLAAAATAQSSDRATELARVEASTIEVSDRLRGAIGMDVRIVLRDGRGVCGDVLDVAREWMLIEDHRGETLIPLAAIDVVHNLGNRAQPQTGVRARLGLGHTLRALSRDRVIVRAGLASGDVVGRIDRVARDHLDLNTRAEPLAGYRPPGGLVLIPFSALLCVSELR